MRKAIALIVIYKGSVLDQTMFLKRNLSEKIGRLKYSAYLTIYRSTCSDILQLCSTQAQFNRKVVNLERLLAEERQRAQALEKRLQLREDSQASQDEQHKMHGMEMHVLKQEVSY